MFYFKKFLNVIPSHARLSYKLTVLRRKITFKISKKVHSTFWLLKKFSSKTCYSLSSLNFLSLSMRLQHYSSGLTLYLWLLQFSSVLVVQKSPTSHFLHALYTLDELKGFYRLDFGILLAKIPIYLSTLFAINHSTKQQIVHFNNFTIYIAISIQRKHNLQIYFICNKIKVHNNLFQKVIQHNSIHGEKDYSLIT